MFVFESLFPILVLMGLGGLLLQFKIFGEGFFVDLNRLSYWVALPALLFIKTAQMEVNMGDATSMFYCLLGAVTGSILLAYALLPFLKMPKSSVGAFIQGSFRGNLAFVGLPVIFYALGEAETGRAVPLLGMAVLLYNAVGTTVLLLHSGKTSSRPLLRWLRLIFDLLTQPMILSCILGLALNMLKWKLPHVIVETFEVVGRVALPVALLSIGAGVNWHFLKGQLKEALVASFLNVLVGPLIGVGIGVLLHLSSSDLLIISIFLAAPAAAASVVSAQVLSNDVILAKKIVVLSTVLSYLSLSFFLWLFGSAGGV